MYHNRQKSKTDLSHNIKAKQDSLFALHRLLISAIKYTLPCLFILSFINCESFEYTIIIGSSRRGVRRFLLKMLHRSIFLTQKPSRVRILFSRGFESFSRKLKHARELLLYLLYSPPGGIRTPVLQNRNLLRYPAAPRAVF